jgi:hypothetical protein
VTNIDEMRAWFRANDLRNLLTPDDETKLEHLKEECEAELTGHQDRAFTEELGWLYDQYGDTAG